MLGEVLNQIEKRQNFILTSHARPDGDAVGSALACAQILRSMGKQASVPSRCKLLKAAPSKRILESCVEK